MSRFTQSPSAEILKNYDNKMQLFPQEATLREHRACSSVYWDLHWAPSGNQDPPLAIDRGKAVGYWTADETCQERSQNQTIFPRRPTTAKVSVTLMRSGGLTALKPQVLSPFPQYSMRDHCMHFLTVHFLSVLISLWKIKCIQSLAFLLPQQMKSQYRV